MRISINKRTRTSNTPCSKWAETSEGSTEKPRLIVRENFPLHLSLIKMEVFLPVSNILHSRSSRSYFQLTNACSEGLWVGGLRSPYGIFSTKKAWVKILISIPKCEGDVLERWRSLCPWPLLSNRLIKQNRVSSSHLPGKSAVMLMSFSVST